MNKSQCDQGVPMRMRCSVKGDQCGRCYTARRSSVNKSQCDQGVPLRMRCSVKGDQCERCGLQNEEERPV